MLRIAMDENLDHRIVPENLGIGIAIEELTVVVECADLADLDNQVIYLPI